MFALISFFLFNNLLIYFNKIKIEIKKPSEQINESRIIEEFKINKLMGLSIEDLINKWKLNLDNQVEKFEKAADSIKNFELNFQNQYDKVLKYNAFA